MLPLTVIGLTLVVFVLTRVMPGDLATLIVYDSGARFTKPPEVAVAEVRQQLGLDKPIVVQYGIWLARLARGDLGFSYWQQQPVARLVAERIPRSMELTLVSIVIAFLVGIGLGTVSALYRNSWIDHLSRLLAVSGISVPLFVTSVGILWLLVRFFAWMPPLDYASPWENPWENLQQVIWPALALAIYISAPVMRLARTQLLEVLREDYIRTARAKGLAERVVVMRHALRNSLIPVLTFLGWWAARIFGGVVIVEVVFAVPGMGRGLLQAVSARDYPLIQGYILALGLAVVLTNFLVDLSYRWLDPRVRHG